MKRTALFIVLSAATSLLHASPWRYQGTLDDGGRPANGQYDLRLTLIEKSGTRLIAQPVTLFGVPVQNGSFAVDVDFGIDLKYLPAMQLRTEVAQAGSAFTSIGEPTPFDPQAALGGICWDTSGNIVSAVEFLGSTNNAPVDIRTNNLRAARFAATGNGDQVNVTLGSASNQMSGRGATIGGGGSSDSTCGPTANAPCRNSTDETYATISGGAANSVVGPLGTVGGGEGNNVQASYGTISGGRGNFAGQQGGFSTIAGGSNNFVSSNHSAVGGGEGNDATQSWSVVSGGQFNEAGNLFATVSGGGNNRALGGSATVSGGVFNVATGSRAAVAGGESVTASGLYSFVAGGLFNCAGGQGSFAGGQRARVRPGSGSGSAGEGCLSVPLAPAATGDAGSFVWADSQGIDFVTSGPNQFLVRAGGGFMVNANTLPNSPIDDVVLGARAAGSGGDADVDVVWLSRSNKRGTIYVSDSTGGFNVTMPNLVAGVNRLTVSGGVGGNASLSNGGAWTNASSRSFKTGFVPVDPLSILAKVVALPISTWTYTHSLEGTHMGPMAEDFKASFGLAGEGQSIATVDADGVALAAIQGLNRKLEQAQAENDALEARLEAIEALIGDP